jgi:hypothetical protein
MITMGHDCVWGVFLGKISEREKGKRKGHWGVKRMEVHCIYTDEDSIMKPAKHCLKEWRRMREWKYNGGGELVQGPLYTCMEFLQ